MFDITRSIVSEREHYLLSGDYDAYHAHATRRLHTLRRNLKITTPRGRKYTSRNPVTAENVTKNPEWIHLLLTNCERSWASAMAMKSTQSVENTQKPMAGSTKRQVVSRLRRACIHAANLVDILVERSVTNATTPEILEARAYMAMMKGSLYFEKSKWQECLEEYSKTKVIYTALSTSSSGDLYKELLSEPVDPSIRYAAYQLKVPRTKPLDGVAVENFPRRDAQTMEELKSLDPHALDSSSKQAGDRRGSTVGPTTITWRGRTVKIEDAAISQAIAASSEQESALSSAADKFGQGQSNRETLAAAYDDVINSRQEAVDATKTAIAELNAEGVPGSDARVQALQVTRTAVEYAVIEWRIGRNRLLCGAQDGLTFEPEKPKPPKALKDGKVRGPKVESNSRKLSRLRERVALYDAIVRSIDGVKELPGVLADTALVAELDRKRSYFRALKCLAIGRSHSLSGAHRNALALYSRASEQSQDASKLKTREDGASPSFSKFDLTQPDVQALTSHLQGLVTRSQGLVELQTIMSSGKSTARKNQQNRFRPPLVERLHMNKYEDDVDLANLVTFPSRLQPVPVKPLFFDIAWNYIQYPGQQVVSNSHANGSAVVDSSKEASQPAKRGWFGFGR